MEPNKLSLKEMALLDKEIDPQHPLADFQLPSVPRCCINHMIFLES